MQFNEDDEMQVIANIAQQNHLFIKKIESQQIGEEMYEQLLYESLYAKESGTQHMMKNNEFDIILNTCKKRQEFKKQVDMLMKS